MGMVYNASSFNRPLGAWDLGQATNPMGMVYNASSFNQPLGAWAVRRCSLTTTQSSLVACPTTQSSPYRRTRSPAPPPSTKRRTRRGTSDRTARDWGGSSGERGREAALCSETNQRWHYHPFGSKTALPTQISTVGLLPPPSVTYRNRHKHLNIAPTHLHRNNRARLNNTHRSTKHVLEFCFVPSALTFSQPAQPVLSPSDSLLRAPTTRPS